MRKSLFDWHLRIGRYAGVLIFIWATSGAIMTVQPMFLRAVDPGFPRLKSAPLNLSAFALPPSRIAPAAASVTLRQFHGRSWYEATAADGSVSAYDAATGAPAAALLSSEEILSDLSARLKDSRWTPRGCALIERNDDQYRKGPVPAYRVEMDGPGGVVAYVSARGGNVEMVTTRWSRAVRWLGQGVHTWNFAAVMRGHDDERGLLLCALVALPVASLALVAYMLLTLRRRSVSRKSKALLASAVALALFANTPGRSAYAALALEASARDVSAPAGVQTIPVLPALETGVSLETSLTASIPPLLSAPTKELGREASTLPTALHVPTNAHATFAPDATMPNALTAAVPLPALSPSTANGTRSLASSESTARIGSASLLSNIGAENKTGQDPRANPVSPETAAQTAERWFDGAFVFNRSAAVPSPESSLGASAPRLNSAAPEDASTIPPSPPSPPGGRDEEPDRKAVWGLYVTQAVHMASLSLIWRIAWPLLVLGCAGKAGLGMLQSADQIADLALGLVSGMVVDKFLARNSMVAASLLRAGVGAALAASALWLSPSLPFLVGLSLAHVFAMSVLYVGQTAASPAAAGSDKESLQRLNILLKLVATAVAIPASLAGGWLVSRVGIPAAFAGYAAVNALVLAPMYQWMFPAPRRAAEPSGEQRPRASLRDILQFISGRSTILALLAATGTAMILTEPLRNTVAPILVKELLHGGAALLGQVMTAFYAGQIAGSLALLRWSKHVSPERWMQLAAAGFGSFWLLALVPQHRIFLFLAVGLMTFLVQPAVTVVKTLLQREVAQLRPDLLGRVLSVHLMIYALAVAAEIALIGWAFSAMASSFLAPIAAIGAAYTALAAIVFLLGKYVRASQVNS